MVNQEIDHDIRDLVVALKEAGCVTLASCQGHAIGWHTPYVYFQCTYEQAQALDKKIANCRLLGSRWELSAHCGEAGLTWLLRSPTWEASLCGGKRLGLLPALWRHKGHQSLANDLNLLASIVAGISIPAPKVTRLRHVAAIALDTVRMTYWKFRFELGLLVGILIGVVM
ncbi:TPA: hypothetical protein RQN23_000743 [Aeromonas veronii]|nr:hypothetical protein [Aeromonas veronii]